MQYQHPQIPQTGLFQCKGYKRGKQERDEGDKRAADPAGICPLWKMSSIIKDGFSYDGKWYDTEKDIMKNQE